jgi:dihydroxy-acid dehydratase
MIIIDIHKRKLEVDIKEEEMKGRLNQLPPFEPKVKGGVLARYAEKVSSASMGGVLLK